MALPAILLAGFLARLVQIQARSLQYDDVFSIFLAKRSLAEIIQGTAADTMPPLYYILLHFWMGLGQTAWVIRGLSVLLSLVAIWLLYRVARLLFTEEAALWAALLAALSPFQYYHAQDVRNYALLCCEQLATLWFFIKLWRAQRQNVPAARLDWLGLILSGTAALYTHNVALLALGVLDIYLLIELAFGPRTALKNKFQFLVRFGLAQAGMLAFNGPWLLLLPGQLAKVQRAWSLTTPGLVDLIQVPVIWTTGLPLPGIWLVVGVLVSLELLVLVIIQAGKGWKNEAGLRLLSTVSLILPGLFFGLSYLMKPIFVARGFILASMSFYAVSGWAIAAGWGKGIGKLILGGFLAAALIGLPAQAFYQDFPRSPYQQAAASLAQETLPDRIVIHDNKLTYFPFQFYEPGLQQNFLADIPGSGNDTFEPASQQAMQIFPTGSIAEAAGDFGVVEFVVFRVTLDEYAGIGQKHPALDWLDAHYVLKAQADFNDLRVYTYRH